MLKETINNCRGVVKGVLRVDLMEERLDAAPWGGELAATTPNWPVTAYRLLLQ
jgi:hypothetical protein